jgi:DNA repair protein RecN (Recombination protein N)
VTLDILTQLGKRLIDVHSQHQTLQLTDHDFQLKVIDALAENGELLIQYKDHLKTFRGTKQALEELVSMKQEGLKELDYNSFLLQELNEAPLVDGILEELEEQYEQLNNVESILEHLNKSSQLIQDEQMGMNNLMAELKQAIQSISSFGKPYEALNDRIQALQIELGDIHSELHSLQASIETNPSMLEEVNDKLQSLHNLQRKHGVADINELIDIREKLAVKVDVTENLDAKIEQKELELADQEKKLGQLAGQLSNERKAICPKLKEHMETSLAELGMPNASFKINLLPADEYTVNGKDNLEFLFAANKGTSYGPLKKVASGGELSRIMLTIKSILSNFEQLPTLMFDEIDSGISGEISNKMAAIMLSMSRRMQIFAITHLPQVASKGDHHFKVFKEDDQNATHTKMKALTQDERIVELAEMLGGKSLSDSALAHAKELLN